MGDGFEPIIFTNVQLLKKVTKIYLKLHMLFVLVLFSFLFFPLRKKKQKI